MGKHHALLAHAAHLAWHALLLHLHARADALPVLRHRTSPLLLHPTTELLLLWYSTKGVRLLLQVDGPVPLLLLLGHHLLLLSSLLLLLLHHGVALLLHLHLALHGLLLHALHLLGNPRSALHLLLDPCRQSRDRISSPCTPTGLDGALLDEGSHQTGVGLEYLQHLLLLLWRLRRFEGKDKLLQALHGLPLPLLLAWHVGLAWPCRTPRIWATLHLHLARHPVIDPPRATLHLHARSNGSIAPLLRLLLLLIHPHLLLILLLLLLLLYSLLLLLLTWHHALGLHALLLLLGLLLLLLLRHTRSQNPADSPHAALVHCLGLFLGLLLHLFNSLENVLVGVGTGAGFSTSGVGMVW